VAPLARNDDRNDGALGNDRQGSLISSWVAPLTRDENGEIIVYLKVQQHEPDSIAQSCDTGYQLNISWLAGEIDNLDNLGTKKDVVPKDAKLDEGTLITYTITISNPGLAVANIIVEDELPSTVQLTDTIVSGVIGQVVQYAYTPTIGPPSSFIWEGSLGESSQFDLVVKAKVISSPWTSINTVTITVDNESITRTVEVGEPEGGVFLPIILKNNN
jgi:uncharacterized repeat protein (TIGR01451 family)